MARMRRHNGLILTAAALTLSALAPLGQVTAVHAATASQAIGSGPTRQQQIRVLTAALRKMRKDYPRLSEFSPGPADIFDYQIGSLWKKGIDGAGTTVAVIEGWNDPQIGSVVKGFDKQFGLPNPQLRTVFPSGDGKLPAQCPPGMVKLGSYGSCDAWQGELDLDVVSVHLIAPYARILISVTPADSEITDDAASQVAPPEMTEALERISRGHLANVISISDGTGESTYSHGHEEITAQNPGELSAAAAGIPVMVATGDCGAAQNLAVANGQCQDITKTRSTAAWDDSPWVTAVGGSTPDLGSRGQRAGPDPVWHFGPFSPGAGHSAVYARPAYQNGVRSVTRSAMRSVPDITMDASDGTSEATPLFAGVLALATQLNHRSNIGPINKVLYDVLGPRGAKDGIADVVKGNNSVTDNGKTLVRGFTAHKGYDVVSGWGTVNASRFVPSLVAATRAQHQDRSVRRQAAADLRQLEHKVQLPRGSIGAGGTAPMSAGGFLPRHPVVLSIDNRVIATLTASKHGSVAFVISPSALGLAPGRHVLRLASMLLTATGGFRSS